MGCKIKNYSNFTRNEASCVEKCLEKMQRKDDHQMQIKYVFKLLTVLDNCWYGYMKQKLYYEFNAWYDYNLNMR